MQHNSAVHIVEELPRGLIVLGHNNIRMMRRVFFQMFDGAIHAIHRRDSYDGRQIFFMPILLCGFSD